MTTTTVTLHPIISAIDSVSKHLDLKNKWNSDNGKAKMFFEKLFAVKDLKSMTKEELKNKISDSADVINQFLKEEGFDIKINPLEAGEIASASVMKILVEWKDEATKSFISVDNKPYATFKHLKPNVEYRNGDSSREAVLNIQTKSGDVVYIKIATEKEKLLDGIDLANYIMNLNDDVRSNFSPLATEYSEVPMIDLNQMVDIGWLVGSYSGDWVIASALQQNKFRMNHIGAKVESAVVVHMKRCVSMPVKKLPPFVVDKPFLIWIMREDDNCTVPYFMAICDKDCWKEPESL